MGEWSKWHPFPDPRKGEYLIAPFGQGVFELRRKSTKELVLFGRGSNVASRMTSLLPRPWGRGASRNDYKREYVDENIDDLEYRTMACKGQEESRTEENRLKANKREYAFPA